MSGTIPPATLLTNVLLLLIVVLLAAQVLGGPAEEASVAGPPRESGDLRELSAALERLRQTLDELPTRAEVGSRPPASTTESRTVEPGANDPEAGAPVPLPSPSYRHDPHPLARIPARPDRVAECLRALESEEEPIQTLLRRFAFRTYRSVLEELGFPTKMFVDERGWAAHYVTADRQWLYLRFMDGIVVQVNK